MSMISAQCDELRNAADKLAMEDREFPFSVHVNESTGRLEVRTDTKVHVYSESENQMILDTVVRLRDENAKLRELVRIMHSELVSCEDNGYVCGGHKFDGRVRELGVEVGG